MNFFDYLERGAVRGSNIDVLIARTQRNASMIVLGMIGYVLYALFLGPKLDPTVEKLLFTVLGGLLSTLAMQNTFWFGRPRAAGVPDPSNTNTTIDQVTTLKQVPAAAVVSETPRDAGG